MGFRKRSYEEELMDDLSASGQVIDQTLQELDVINRLLGGNQVTTNGLELLREGSKKLTIADLGCGSGAMLKIIDSWAAKVGITVELIGFDANPSIIEYAEKACANYDSIRFVVEDIFSNEFKMRRFDIIICTLFTHHFHEQDLVRIFKQFKDQSKLGIVINDLHRHWVAYYSIKVLTQLFSRSKMVKNDGPLSVKRAFKKQELLNILKQADIEVKHLSWQWAFRWQLVF